MIRIITFLYQWLIAIPILLILTILTALTTLIGCRLGNGNFWGYYPAHIWSHYYLLSCQNKLGAKETSIKTHLSYSYQTIKGLLLIYGYLNHNFKWMMKKSLRNIPFVGSACAAAGHIFVDNSTPGRLKETLQKAETTLQNGMSLVVFPEGARTWTGAMRPFKRGAYQLAVEFSLPVAPLTIDGAFAVMPRTTYNFKPGKIILTIHPSIYPQENKGHDIEDLMKKSYAVIESALPLKG